MKQLKIKIIFKYKKIYIREHLNSIIQTVLHVPAMIPLSKQL